jgi:hypothetical protein
MQRKHLGLVLLVAISAIEAPVVSAQTCELPPGFVDSPHPEIAPVEELVSHTEEVTIERSMAVLQYSAARTPLEQGIDRTSGLPSVTGTHRLTEVKFPEPGARRLICLSDGSTVVEQVLANEQGADSTRYRYVLWNYTSPKFPAISYAIGEIVRSAVSDTRTSVRWTFSFQPDRNRWPGSLGESGDALFRDTFVERQFAERMRKSLAGGKKRAEQIPPSFDPSKQSSETATKSDARAQTTR